MAEDRWEQLVERSVGGPVSSGSMFGSRGLRTGKKFFALWWQGQLVVKLPAERRQELAEAGQAETFEPMEGRPMNGWALLHATAEWDPLVTEARSWTESQR